LRAGCLSPILDGMASPLTPDRLRAAGPLAALGALAAVAAAVIGMVAIGTSLGQRLDDGARGGVSAWWDPEAYGATSRFLDTISVASLAILGAVLMATALVRGRPRLAIAAGAVLLGANLTTQVLKEVVDRPDLVEGAGVGPGSFPSGHTTVAMSLAMALVIVVPPALRWIAAVGGCAYAASVGIAVVAIDWHRPSEVVGAYLVVVAWTGLVMAGLVASGEDPGGADARLGGLGAALAAAMAGVFAIVVWVEAARRLDVGSAIDDRTAFAAGAAACALACALLGAVTTAAIQRASSSPRAVPQARVRRDARRHPHRRG